MSASCRRGILMGAIAQVVLVLLQMPAAHAVPACPGAVTVRQPDGKRITIILKGDEWRHWYEDANGYPIIWDRHTRQWMYATEKNGKLRSSGALVGRANPGLLRFRRHVSKAFGRGAPRPRRFGWSGGQGAPTTGTAKNLVILVQFSDLKGTRTKSEFEDLFNKTGYNTDGAQGSVQDYYHEISYNALTMDSIVTDWITVDNGYAYYGANFGGYSGYDMRPQEMVEEALNKLDDSGFDFKTVDGDGDGEVDGLDIIHAGGGEEYGGNDPDYIWSHMSAITAPVTYDGVTVYPYHTEPERRGWDDYPSTQGITRIGVICHETGHFLGLPDLYDYDYDSEGAGSFCLMAGGSWNGDYGTSPAHMSAWCKVTLNWVSPTLITGSGTYTLKQVEDNAQVYKLSGSFASPKEYFVVENRQGFGFDGGLPGTTRGILIWHVDENQPDNDDQTHYKVDLEEASGTQHLELNSNSGDDSDYFRSGNATAFSATTTPNNKSYSGEDLGLDVTDVSTSGSSMTFVIGGGTGTTGDTVTVSGASLAPSTVTQGQTGVAMEKLGFLVDANSTVLKTLKIDESGTSSVASDVASIKIYSDSNGNTVFDPGSDTLIGSATPTTQTTTVDITDQTINAGSSLLLFVVYDVGANAAVDKTLGVKLTDTSYVTVESPDTVSTSNFPISSGEAKILAAGDTVTVTGASLAPGTVTQGQAGVAMERLTLSVNANAAVVTELKVDESGNSNAATDVTSIRVYKDANGNLAFDPSSDSFLGSATPSSQTTTVDIADETINAGTNLVLFVVYDVSIDATVGATLGAKLTDSSYVTVDTPDIVSAANFPLTSGNATIVAAGDTLTVQGSSVAPSEVTQGQTNVAMEKLTLSVNANSAVATMLTVEESGSSTTASDVARISIYKDANANGAFDAGGDTLIGAATPSTQTTAISLTSQTVNAGTDVVLFIVYDVGVNAAEGQTLGVKLADANSVTVQSPDTVNGSFPIVSGNATIAAAADAYEEDDSSSQAKTHATNGTLARHNFIDDPNDWATFSLPDSRPTTMETLNLGSRADTVLYLYDSNLNLIAWNDDGGGGWASKIVQALAAGTYYLKVYSWQGRWGSGMNYDLRITAPSPPLGDAYEEDDTSGNAKVHATDGTLHRHNFVDDTDDWAVFTLTQSRVATVETLNLGSSADTVLYLYDSNLKQLTWDDDSGGEPRASRVTQSLAAGMYYIRVWNWAGFVGSNTDYDLRITLGSAADAYEEDDAWTAAKVHATDGSLYRHNFVDDSTDWAMFTLTSPKATTIETVNLGSLADTLLYLYDGNLTLLAYDDDGGSQPRSSKIVQLLTPGTFYVKVANFAGRIGDNTNYDLRISVPAGAPQTWFEEDDSPLLAKGQPPDGKPRRRNFLEDSADWVTFMLSEPEVITVETLNLGRRADTVLRLYDRDLNSLAFDDDSGSEPLASKVVQVLGPGRYYVRVGNFASRIGGDTHYDLKISAFSPGGDSLGDEGSP